MPEWDFTQPKFLRLPLYKQHKHCARLVRHLYDLASVDRQQAAEKLGLYNSWCKWMSRPSLESLAPQELSDAYHNHLSHANVRLHEHNFLPKVKKGDQSVGETPWPIVVYLDNLRSSHNVGSILRTVEAFALGKVVFSGQTPDASHPQVQNTSMGAYQWVEWENHRPLSELPKPVIALETTEGAASIHDFLFPNSFTLAVGNEEYGCSEETLQCADYHVEIPLRGRKNSLNVANSFAIAAAEIQRQRGLNL